MSVPFNRKERLKISKKLNKKRPADRINWHASKVFKLLKLLGTLTLGCAI